MKLNLLLALAILLLTISACNDGGIPATTTGPQSSNHHHLADDQLLELCWNDVLCHGNHGRDEFAAMREPRRCRLHHPVWWRAVINLEANQPWLKQRILKRRFLCQLHPAALSPVPTRKFYFQLFDQWPVLFEPTKWDRRIQQPSFWNP